MTVRNTRGGIRFAARGSKIWRGWYSSPEAGEDHPTVPGMITSGSSTLNSERSVFSMGTISSQIGANKSAQYFDAAVWTRGSGT
jgi:hypothetical protein